MKKFNCIISHDTIFVIIIFITGFTIFNSVRHFPDAIIENNKLKDLLIKEKDEKKHLEDILKTISDPKTKIDAARMQYHISKKGDLIFIFPERKANDEKK